MINASGVVARLSHVGKGVYKRRGFATLIVVGAAVCGLATAFDPDAATYGHTHITRSIADIGYGNPPEQVLPFTAKVAGEELTFSATAVDQLVLGARSIDFLFAEFKGAGANGTYLSDEVVGGLELKGLDADPLAHCDDELIVDCSNTAYKWSIGPDNGSSYEDKMHHSSALNLLFDASELWPKSGHDSLAESFALSYAAAARVQLGRALHVTQDFYAHSSWSDARMGTAEYLKEFGKLDQNRFIENQVAQGVTCESRVVSPETVALLRNYFGEFRDFADDRNEGHNLLVTFAHAYADFAANTDIKPSGAEALLTKSSTSLKRLLTWENSGGNWKITSGRLITSGHFNGFQHAVLGLGSAKDGTLDGRIPTKCDHGFVKDGVYKGITLSAKSHLSGINKDAPWSPFAPQPVGGELQDLKNPSRQHVYASYHAALATKQIFENMIEAIEQKSGYTANPSSPAALERRDTMVQLFLGIRPVVTFVVDTTGSMQDVMDGVAEKVAALAKQEALAASDFEKPIYQRKKFMLVTYGDDTGTASDIILHKLAGEANTSSAGSPDQLAARLKSLPLARGGRDCEEPTMAAVLLAVKKSPRDSKIFVFTDASSKDNVVMGTDRLRRLESAEITRLMKLKNIQVTFSVSGSCSPIDTNYKQIAKASGSQMLLVDHSNSDVSVAFAGIVPGGRPMSLVHMEEGNLFPSSQKEVILPVESDAREFLITVTLDGHSDIAVRDPSGRVHLPTKFLGGAVLKVSNPLAGNWVLSVYNSAKSGAPALPYSIKAQMLGAFDLLSVGYSDKYIQEGGHHETYLTYESVPPAADVRITAKLATTAANNPGTYAWQAIAEDGSVLGNLDVNRQTIDQYEGTAALGSISAGATRAFRIRVGGIDSSGKPFARMLPVLQSAKRLHVSLSQLPPLWMPGATHRFKLRVDNYGSGDTVTIGVGSDIGKVVDGVRSMEVAQGGHVLFDVEVHVPANISPNDTGSVSLTIKSRVGGSAPVESLSIPLYVQADADGDGVPDRVEKGRVGIDEVYDSNADGVPDWQQAHVISFHSHNRKAYITAVLSSGAFKLARTLAAEGMAGFQYNIDLIDFKIVGLTPGAATTIKMILPDYLGASGYGKFGPEHGNGEPHWYDFKYDEVSKAGAEVNGNRITLSLVDGARGDNDLKADGVIVAVGGPVHVVVQHSSSNTSADNVITPPGKSGGGCTVGDPTRPDATLALLALLAMCGIGYRARRSRREA